MVAACFQASECFADVFRDLLMATLLKSQQLRL